MTHTRITDQSDRYAPYANSVYGLASQGTHVIRFMKLAEAVTSGLMLATGSDKWAKITTQLKISRTVLTAIVRVPKARFFLTQPKGDNQDDWREQFVKTISPLFFGTFAGLSLLKLLGSHGIISGTEQLGKVGLWGGLLCGSFIASVGTGYLAYCAGWRAHIQQELLCNPGGHEFTKKEREAIEKDIVNFTLEAQDNVLGAAKYGTEWLVAGVGKTLLLPFLARRVIWVGSHKVAISFSLTALANSAGSMQSLSKVLWERKDWQAEMYQKLQHKEGEKNHPQKVFTRSHLYDHLPLPAVVTD